MIAAELAMWLAASSVEQPVSRSGQKPINMDEERRKRRGA